MGPAVFQTGLARENVGLQPFPFAREPIGLVRNMSTKLLYGTQTEKWGSAGVSPEAWPPAHQPHGETNTSAGPRGNESSARFACGWK
jgi:hypothetical protein